MYNSALTAYVRAGLEIVGVVRAEREMGLVVHGEPQRSRWNRLLELFIPECLALGHPGKATATSLS